jgi:hypothetical protein
MSTMNFKTNEHDRKALLGVLREISDAMHRMEAERELIKEIIEEKAPEFELAFPVLRKMGRVYHKGDADRLRTSNEDFFEMYSAVVDGPAV